MTTSAPSYTLRLATAAELAQAVALDDASALLFTQAGIVFDLPNDHPFVVAEHTAWRRAIAAKQLWFACFGALPIGFCALGRAGDRAYLEQLSVLSEHGRRGVGAMLLEAAFARCREQGDSELWLTTYAHIPWNRPYYERHGFRVIPEVQCNAELRAVLEAQRSALPEPSQRIAMMRKLG